MSSKESLSPTLISQNSQSSNASQTEASTAGYDMKSHFIDYGIWGILLILLVRYVVYNLSTGIRDILNSIKILNGSIQKLNTDEQDRHKQTITLMKGQFSLTQGFLMGMRKNGEKDKDPEQQ